VRRPLPLLGDAYCGSTRRSTEHCHQDFAATNWSSAHSTTQTTAGSSQLLGAERTPACSTTSTRSASWQPLHVDCDCDAFYDIGSVGIVARSRCGLRPGPALRQSNAGTTV